MTSNYATRRTRYIALKLAPPGMTVSVASARDGDFDPEHWWEKRSSIKAFLAELVGMVDAMWELRGVGKTGPVAVPGHGTRFSGACSVDRHVTGLIENVGLRFTCHKCCNMFIFLSCSECTGPLDATSKT